MDDTPADKKGQRISAEKTGGSRTRRSATGPAQSNWWVWVIGIALLIAVVIAVATYLA